MKRKIFKSVPLIIILLFSILIYLLIFSPPPCYPYLEFPAGKDFAFTIFDDTDGATIEEIKPLYDYLYKYKIITTKSVWVLPTNDPINPANHGQSLSDSSYLSFILNLKNKGFEIALHNVRGGSTKRYEIKTAIEDFRNKIGHYPYTHVNHLSNKENIYWGKERLDIWPLKLIYGLIKSERSIYFEGNLLSSDYFWGDIIKGKIKYVRNYTFHNINTLQMNPAMPYHDINKPYVNLWFSSSDGHDVNTFNNLLKEENLDRLEQEHGVCIIYTHFSNGFVIDGVLNETTKIRIQDLASRNGYFVPVNTILEFLDNNNSHNNILSLRENISMQLRWIYEKIIYGSS